MMLFILPECRCSVAFIFPSAGRLNKLFTYCMQQPCRMRALHWRILQCDAWIDIVGPSHYCIGWNR